MPALLITGGQDPTTSPEQRDAFHHASSRHTIAEFERAGHFVHADDPGGMRDWSLTSPEARATVSGIQGADCSNARAFHFTPLTLGE